MPTPTPFQISISEDLLSFITSRIKTARIAPPGRIFPKAEAWKSGPPPEVISQIKTYWAEKYDWRAVEARINSELKMFTLPIEEAGEELTVHFVWHRSERDDAIPLLFQHGWPGSFLEVEKILNLLTSPADPKAQAYHVIAPSLPGFGFSSSPKNPDFSLKEMAAVNHKLMLALGYSTYMVQGGDWGSLIVQVMAIDYPEHCIACHVNMVTTGLPSWWRNPLVFARVIVWAALQGEGTMFKRMLWWIKEESGYLEIQGTKPQALAYALTDSPIGMLAWILDKLHVLIDDDFSFSEEDIITWTMMYIIPSPAGSAPIYKLSKAPLLAKTMEDWVNKVIPPTVAFGASIFSKDVQYAPRFWAQCTVASNIVFWREHDKGGHFASVEKPDMLVADVREFTEGIGKASLARLRKGRRE